METVERWGALGFMAVAVIAGAVVANAPDGMPWLWAIKVVAAAGTGLAALFMHPPFGAAGPQTYPQIKDA